LNTWFLQVAAVAGTAGQLSDQLVVAVQGGITTQQLAYLHLLIILSQLVGAEQEIPVGQLVNFHQ
jgi:hypothetical protein